MQDALRRRELAAFLRHYRQALDPAAAGLPPDPRRRRPGLRREELAILAGVGLTWYTWLEQARPVNPSAQVIDALARALALDADAHDHLRRLASLPALPRSFDTGMPAEALVLLDTLSPSAAYVSDDHWNVLAWNRAEAVLLPELDTCRPEDRNIIWLLFTAPTPRQTMPDWDNQARRVLSQFRAQHGGRLDDPADRALIDRLNEASAEFRALWPEPDVSGFSQGDRPFQHPELGPLRFHHHKLAFVDRPDLRLTMYTPADEPTRERLRGHLAGPAGNSQRRTETRPA